MRMRRIMLSYVAHPALQYISTLPHKRHDFRKKKKKKKTLLNIQDVLRLTLELSSEKFLIFRI